MQVKEILEAALKLSPEDRAQLIEELTASLPNDFASKDVERAWLDEIDCRSDEIDAGTADLVEWSEVRERIAQRRAGEPRRERSRSHTGLLTARRQGRLTRRTRALPRSRPREARSARSRRREASLDRPPHTRALSGSGP